MNGSRLRHLGSIQNQIVWGDYWWRYLKDNFFERSRRTRKERIGNQTGKQTTRECSRRLGREYISLCNSVCSWKDLSRRRHLYRLQQTWKDICGTAEDQSMHTAIAARSNHCSEATTSYATTQFLFEQRTYQAYERWLRSSVYMSISLFHIWQEQAWGVRPDVQLPSQQSSITWS